MPPRRAVELRVGGQTYRVVATDNDQHVQRLAELVDRKFAEVVPQGRGVTGQQAMFLIAMALAEEAEEQRARAARLEAERDRSLRLASRAREVVARLLRRVDSALSALPPDGSKSSTPPPVVEPRALSPLDRLTEPPDVMHEPVLIELMPPSTRDRQPPSEAVWPPASTPWAGAKAPPSAPGREQPPLSASSLGTPASSPPSSTASLPGNETSMPKATRPGLRLVRQSSSDDEPR